MQNTCLSFTKKLTGHLLSMSQTQSNGAAERITNISILGNIIQARGYHVCIAFHPILVASQPHPTTRFPNVPQASSEMISGPSIATLVVFILSTIFVICPTSFPIRLPFFGRLRFPINLNTAPIIAIAILWATQCIGHTQIRDGIVGTGKHRSISGRAI